jgi:hypothetical protein
MSCLKKVVLSLGLVFLIGVCAERAQAAIDVRSATDILLDNHKAVNVVDDFLFFWERAKGRPLRIQRRLWIRMVERPHAEFFERAVYRNASAAERRQMLNRFLLLVPDHIDGIRAFNDNVYDALTQAIIFFKVRFPDYKHQHDLYIGLGLFRFDGSVRALDNDEGIPDTLCLAADLLADYSPEELQITLAHEFFHLYHFEYLFEHASLDELRTPHAPLMIEGMAIVGSQQVYSSTNIPRLLHFSRSQLALQKEQLADNSLRFLTMIRWGAPPEEYIQWFMNGLDADIPSRGGYLLGYEATRGVLASHTLDEMVRMSPMELREQAEEQLAAMSGAQFMMISDN